MTICGDIQYMMNRRMDVDIATADDMLAEIFDFLTSADVILWLATSDDRLDIANYGFCIAELRDKCLIGKPT